MRPSEQECRAEYKAVGWPCYWPYDKMPEWLRPAWHHDGPATEIQRRRPSHMADEEWYARREYDGTEGE